MKGSLCTVWDTNPGPETVSQEPKGKAGTASYFANELVARPEVLSPISRRSGIFFGQ